MLKSDEKEEIIDAAAEIKRREQGGIAGERGPFRFGARRLQLPAGAKPFLLVILACAVAIGGVLTWKAWQVRVAAGKDAKADDNIVRNTLPALKPLASRTIHDKEPGDAPLSKDMPPSDQDLSQEAQQAGLTAALQTRRLSGGLTDGSSKADGAGRQPIGHQGYTSDNENELQNRLEPLRLNPSAAGLTGEPNYLLTQGTMIDCQLETKMVTTQPGMTSCYATRNIYSTNGRVVLIDRGSKIVGHYQGGIQQGQARIFVLWSRIETPKGVVVNLDSPGSGPLGEGGVGGTIDTHFWQRFGGAVMISLIGDLGQYAANQGQKGRGSGNNTTIQLNNTTQGMQQAATEALRNSINIPPTLYKNQGDRVSIFVARDLDFGKVYGLKGQ